jgi:hypothetical protein
MNWNKIRKVFKEADVVLRVLAHLTLILTAILAIL